MTDPLSSTPKIVSDDELVAMLSADRTNGQGAAEKAEVQGHSFPTKLFEMCPEKNDG